MCLELYEFVSESGIVLLNSRKRGEKSREVHSCCHYAYEAIWIAYFVILYITEDLEDPMSPVSEMDTNVYNPPDTLQIPPEACQSDSAYSAPESDSSSSQETSTSPDVRYQTLFTLNIFFTLIALQF